MTVASNIHVGLAGWSNATYAAGQRISNAGNAYQCTSPGTSTAPPTGTGIGITPGGTSVWKYLSAVDFSTLQAWASSIPTTLTQPIIGLLWNDSVITATAGTSILTLTGHTTSGSNTITLMPATGEGFLSTFVTAPTTPFIYNNANGVSIEFPITGFGGINYINVDDSNVIFRELQIKDLNASSGATMVGGGGMIWVDKCIIDGQSQSGGALMIQMGAASVKVTNSLIIDRSIGSPASATVEAVGTGCAIVCSTFVRTAPSTPSAALNAGSNTTTASNIVRNSIFVGYTTPFIATSGGPQWATDHNAYTNATFTSTSAATDTGGSVYSATTSTLFVNTTTDYHQNSSSPCLNAGVTDSTDITTSDDIFGTTRPQGAAWDIGPHELLAGSIILRDVIAPSEFDKAIMRDVISSEAFTIGSVSSLRSTIEYRNSIAISLAASIDASTTVNGDTTNDDPFSGEFSGEFGSGLSLNVASVPIEWIMGVAQPFRNVTFPIEWNVSASASPVTFIDWRSQPFTNNVMSIDFPANDSVDRSFPTAFSENLSETIGAPIDFKLSAQSDMTAFDAIYASVSESATVPSEWNGVSTLSADAQTPIEWRSSLLSSAIFNADRTAPFDVSRQTEIEWITTAAGLSVSLPTEWRSTILAESTGSTDWQSPFIGSYINPLEFVESTLNTWSFPLATSDGIGVSLDIPHDHYALLTLSAIESLTIGVTVNENSIAPMEIGGGSGGGATADSVFSLEIGGGIFGSVNSLVEIKSSPRVDYIIPNSVGSVSFVDYRMGSAWLSTPLSLAISPVAWDQLLIALRSDTTMPIEILATVNVSINIPYNQRVGQETIGSYLTPDAWEGDNEPPCS